MCAQGDDDDWNDGGDDGGHLMTETGRLQDGWRENETNFSRLPLLFAHPRLRVSSGPLFANDSSTATLWF